MTARIFGWTIGLAASALGAAFPAWGQFAPNYPIIVVPPPAQNYATPKSEPRGTTASKPKPPDNPPESPPAPAYQGQTRLLNRF